MTTIVIDWTIKSLQESLAYGAGLSNWVAPLGGVKLGKPRFTSGDSLDGLIQQSIRLSASLSKLAKVKTDLDQKKRDQAWKITVANYVEDLSPSLAKYFNHRVQLSNTSVFTRFGFLSERYAANFSSINSERISNANVPTQSKILELGTFLSSDLVVKPQSYELIIKTDSVDDISLPEETRAEIRNRVEHFRAIAQGRGVNVVAVQTPLQAAQLIIEAA